MIGGVHPKSGMISIKYKNDVFHCITIQTQTHNKPRTNNMSGPLSLLAHLDWTPFILGCLRFPIRILFVDSKQAPRRPIEPLPFRQSSIAVFFARFLHTAVSCGFLVYQHLYRRSVPASSVTAGFVFIHTVAYGVSRHWSGNAAKDVQYVVSDCKNPELNRRNPLNVLFFGLPGLMGDMVAAMTYAGTLTALSLCG